MSTPRGSSETTVAWFDNFCTTFAPVFDVGSQPAPGDTDLAAAKATGTKLISVGNQISEDAVTLAGLDAPTFADGEELANAAVEGLN